MGNKTVVPKKVLRKRNKTQREMILELQEENNRLTRENNRNADMVQWLYPMVKGMGIGYAMRDFYSDVLDRAGVKVDE